MEGKEETSHFMKNFATILDTRVQHNQSQPHSAGIRASQLLLHVVGQFQRAEDVDDQLRT